MPRTTVDIEAPILRELKALGQRERRPLGKLISVLVAEALARRNERRPAPPRLAWISKPMHATVDWTDTDALEAILEQDDREKLAAAGGATSGVSPSWRCGIPSPPPDLR
ncbi:MAG: hypothetical protein HY332_01640 [Chloroflexi bacterium]|nr:hypothetical protein [Chloroflexota bacterium]